MNVLQEGHQGNSDRTDCNRQNLRILRREIRSWDYRVPAEGLRRGEADGRFRGGFITFTLTGGPSFLQ